MRNDMSCLGLRWRRRTEENQNWSHIQEVEPVRLGVGVGHV